MPDVHTLLLTDVIDSTQLNQRLGDAVMGPLWAAHDRSARDLMRRWRGREVARSDGFLVMFGAVADAAGFAVDYHRALQALPEPLAARVGIHQGELALRDNSAADVARGAPPFELDGVALPLASRVMSMAVASQTLLTADAQRTLGPTPYRVQSHGHWRMKGIEEPVEVFELGAAGAPFMPPPDSAKAYRVVPAGGLWLPRGEIRHTLPAERDSFVGRAAALRQIAGAFDGGARLVSLLGTGGAGKTRTAVRFGWSWLGEFPGGVWFCDLSSARSADGVAHAAAKGLQVLLGGTDPIEQIGRVLAGRGPCLLVLDNAEPVRAAVAAAVKLWLSLSGDLRVLVTTREILGVAGELVADLAPLTAAESAALFVERAQAAVGRFEPGTDDSAAIERLVALLDGLPLAVELAAARVRVMPPRQVLERMRERFKLLSSPGRNDDPHATLRGVLDGSWDLLSPTEKSALAQLSVFEGGFTLAAAEAVLELPVTEGRWAVDVVQTLVEKSLVRRTGEHRLDLLQSIREYAAEHLGTAGRFDGSGPGAQSAAWSRHGRHFAACDEAAALADGGAEVDNFVVACRRAAARGDGAVAGGALRAAWWVLQTTGPFRVASELTALLDGLPNLERAQRAAVDCVAGCAAKLMGEPTLARARLESAADAARAAALPDVEVDTLCALADVLMTTGELPRAEAALQRALERARQVADSGLELKACNGIGSLSIEKGHLELARVSYEQALTLALERGDERWAGALLSNLGALHYAEGRLDAAEAHFERALALAGRHGHRRWEGSARCNLGLMQHEHGRHHEARNQFEAALRIARDMGHAQLEGTVQCNLGLVSEALGEPAAAQRHYEAAVAIAATMGDLRSEGQFRGYLGLLYAAGGQADEARACLDRAEAHLTHGADALSLGVLLCQRARAEAVLGRSDAAHAALARAAQIEAESGVGALSELGRAVAAARQALAAGPISSC